MNKYAADLIDASIPAAYVETIISELALSGVACTGNNNERWSRSVDAPCQNIACGTIDGEPRCHICMSSYAKDHPESVPVFFASYRGNVGTPFTPLPAAAPRGDCEDISPASPHVRQDAPHDAGGTPPPANLYRDETRNRFWSKVSRADDCWTWAGAQIRGYGIFQLNGRARKAHRIAYEMTYGPIPDNLFVCHRCDNPPCVRPDHLWLGTADDNAKDRVAKGRARGPYNHGRGYKLPAGCNAGERNPRAKMTRATVTELRRRYATGLEFLKNLASEYGIAFSTASKIVRYETWKEVN